MDTDFGVQRAHRFRNYSTTDILVSVFIAGITFLVLRYHWRKRHVYKHSLKMNGPVSLPILGNSLLFRGNTKDILETIMRLHLTYKPLVRFWLGSQFAVLIGTPEYMDQIFNSPLALKKAHVYKYMQPVVGDGIFSVADVNKWKKHRKLIITTFNQKVLNSYMDVYAEQSQIFVEKVEKEVGKGEFDVFPYAYALTLDIIGKTILDCEINEQNQKSDLSHWLDTCMNVTYHRIFKPWLHSDFVFNQTKMSKDLEVDMSKVLAFIQKMLTKKRQEYSANKANNFVSDEKHKFKSTMELLVALSKEGELFSDKQIVDELITLMVGGSDSSANVDSFALMMLGMHQDVQEKVYEELKDIFGDSDRPVCVEDLPHMKVLERVIKETMRLFPVGPVVAREAIADITLGPHTIPKGTILAMCIQAMHRDPNVWKDPLLFDPDRFLPENFSKMKPSSYLPFSGGPRNCIGPNFAMMSMKCVLSTFMRKYKAFCRYKTVDSIACKADIMLRAVDGNFISIEHRN